MNNTVIAFRIIANIIVIYWCSRFFFLLKGNNQWENAPDLHFEKYPHSEGEMNYNIYEVMNQNEALNTTLESLRKTLFFKIFKLNLEPDCSVFKQEQICKSSSCQICECESNEVPKIWQQQTHFGENINFHIEDSFDKWIDKFSTNTKQWLIQEDIDSDEGTFVNLLKNPEGYTGYRGAHIWDAIFRENCFSDRVYSLCKEDKTFYRIFSGWLSNTNMQIGINYKDPKYNETFLNLTMITSRLLMFKERVDNFFFLYSLMIKAFNKAKPFILAYDYHSGNEEEDKNTINLLHELYNHSKELEYLEDAFNETTEDFEYFMNSGKINELISRFKNISSIIDCVSCSKCRMHAKLEVFGIATMLKIMFSSCQDLEGNMIRNELVSFINLFAKLSKTVSYIKYIDDGIKIAKNLVLAKLILIFSLFIIVIYFLNVWILKNPKNKKKKK